MPERRSQACEKLQRQSFAFHRTLLLSLLTFACLGQWLPPYEALVPYRSTAKKLWPQAWSFYTDVAGGTQVSAYRFPTVQGRVPETLLISQLSWANLGGFRRVTNAQLAELARVSAAISSEQWRVCHSGQMASCLPTPSKATLTVVNAAPSPTLCGSVLLAVERWVTEHAETAVRTERLVFAELLCPGR